MRSKRVIAAPLHSYSTLVRVLIELIPCTKSSPTVWKLMHIVHVNIVQWFLVNAQSGMQQYSTRRYTYRTKHLAKVYTHVDCSFKNVRGLNTLTGEPLASPSGAAHSCTILLLKVHLRARPRTGSRHKAPGRTGRSHICGPPTKCMGPRWYWVRGQ
jgi:hypothetical protein